MTLRRALQAAALVLFPAMAAAAPPPLAAVGLVQQGGRGGCTGTLIAPDLVLTAAHCANKGEGEDAGDAFIFRTGAYPGYPAVERKGTDIATHPFARGPRDPSVRGLRHDIALLRLAEPVPPDVAEPMAVAPMAVLDRPPVVAAFRGNSTVRARQRSCPILERRGEMLILSCAVRKGESGAPVIAVTGDDLAVVAVVSAQSKVMRTEVALAVVAAGPVRAVRALFPDGS